MRRYGSGCALIAIILGVIPFVFTLTSGSKDSKDTLNSMVVFFTIIAIFIGIIFLSKMSYSIKEKRKKKNDEIMEGFRIITENSKRREKESQEFIDKLFNKNKDQINTPSTNKVIEKDNNKNDWDNLPRATEQSDDLPF